MIADIKNPWLRRSIIVVTGLPLFVLFLLVDMTISIVESAASAKFAWEGRFK